MKDNLENIIARDDKLDDLERRSRKMIIFIVAVNIIDNINTVTIQHLTISIKIVKLQAVR